MIQEHNGAQPDLKQTPAALRLMRSSEDIARLLRALRNTPILSLQVNAWCLGSSNKGRDHWDEKKHSVWLKVKPGWSATSIPAEFPLQVNYWFVDDSVEKLTHS